MRIRALITTYPLTIAILVVFFIHALYANYGNGQLRCDGQGQICDMQVESYQMHDEWWHMAVAQVAFVQLPPRLPIADSTQLTGYHYLYHLFAHILTYAGLSITTVHWRVVPVIFAISMGWLLLAIARRLHITDRAASVSALLLTAGGSLSLLHNIYHGRSIANFEVISNINASSLVVSKLAWAGTILSLTTMYLLTRRDLKYRHVYIALLILITSGTKIYFGTALYLYCVSVSAIAALRGQVSHRRALLEIVSYTMGIGSALLLILQVSSQTGLIWSPFALTRSSIESDSLYPHPTLVLMRYSLEAAHTLSPRLIFIELYSALIFLLHHLGVRILSLILLAVVLFRHRRDALMLALPVPIIFTMLMPVLFIQRVDWWNTIQYLDVTSLYLSMAALLCAQYLTTRYRSLVAFGVVFALVAILSVPDQIIRARGMQRDYTIITHDELSALAYLSSQSEGAVYTIPTKPNTAYIAALSGKPLYYAMPKQVGVLGKDDVKKRLESVVSLPAAQALTAAHPTYVYVDMRSPHAPDYLGALASQRAKLIFRSHQIQVYLLGQ